MKKIIIYRINYFQIVFFIFIFSAHFPDVNAEPANAIFVNTLIRKYQLDTLPIVDTSITQIQSMNSPEDSLLVIPDSSIIAVKDSVKKSYLKNNIKFNLSALAFNNYSLTYERSLTPKISFSFGYRYMPTTNMANTPLAKKIVKYVDGDESDIKDELENIVISGNAITPEFRFYMGRKRGARGFYASIYGRFASYKYDYDFTYSTDNSDYNIPLKGEAKIFGAGAGFGFQFLIAKRVVVDFYILGAHIGKINGDGIATTDLSTMSDAEQAELEETLDTAIEFRGKQLISADVNDNGVKLNIKGPFGGIRGLGLSIGIAF